MEYGKTEIKREVDLKLAAGVLLVILAAVLLFSRVGAVEKAIDAIGTVTLSSREAIAAAEDAYAALKPEQQARVDNYGQLTAARDEYECLVAEDAIDRIGDVDLDSQEAIAHAEQVLEALSPELRKSVDNLDRLKAARKSYDRMVAQVRAAADAIDAIGTVDLQSGNLVSAAREAADALARLEKDTGARLLDALGDRMAVLTAAEEAYEALVVDYRYEEAMALFNGRDYTGALEAFRTLAEQYPNSARTEQAQQQVFLCTLQLAEQALGKREFYTAMSLMKSVDGSHTSSEEYTALMNRLTGSLASSRPGTGVKMKNDIPWGWCELRVTADTQDICVKVVSASDPAKTVLFYVQSGGTFTVNLEDGSYDIFYTSGENWFDQTHGFGDDAYYAKAVRQLSLSSWTVGYTVYYYRYDLDLKNSYNNDLDTKQVSAKDFWG